MADLFSPDDDAPQASSAAANYFHPGLHSPLAVRMRPRSLDEVVGQEKVLGAGSPLRRLIEGHGETSVILYGPPGTGKTTVASLISSASGRHFESLSALNSGVKEVRAVIEEARRRLVMGEHTVLFIDEVHRFSKTQQDALLSAVENRTVLLVAATTENPSFSVVAPLLSRSLLVQLESLSDSDIRTVLQRAIHDERGLNDAVALDDEALDYLVALSAGDARRSLTYLEAASETTIAASTRGNTTDTPVAVTAEDIRQSINRAVVRYDRDGDQHYDVTSAFIKSIRGSDPDAALHYLARMLEAGEDPRFISRRLVIHASEDIGMADPSALQIAVAAHHAVTFIGMPEARLNLAQATIHLATAPKSNAVISAIGRAVEDVRAGKGHTVPVHLRDGHYQGAKDLGNAVGYKYPHDDPKGVVPQHYLPDDLQDAVYYTPTQHGHERTISARLESLRAIVRGWIRGK
ncbi:replication-associated recombination protein A [Corynebacterium sp. 320]|uniref:replication-associated recombination protein A n=1 Tax=Corynebacterium TaxID=1716 RepID=UPI00125CAE34|nr:MULTISPECIES: replication-associated recombination protein A [Corynebacterium]KAB1503714.1 replication-associated recombination protein A [Corynebacterium sp. 320]KAB1553185.1 replication-associated recombination protein A [Corynebacterium sp. 321]KAB1553596.1 replication-associated recombination protein A [Corynebacterium sp. 319]KAB3527850.1 replication-associated recombination protein A [Corynebacterium sp. 250]KAB3540661.1 replication-associated recombination protein A [Corynebacterium 